jgi:GTP-binding protein EngB required for normal cell division
MQTTQDPSLKLLENINELDNNIKPLSGHFNTHSFLEKAITKNEILSHKFKQGKIIRIPILGNMNTGKTTFVNSLLGQNILEMASITATKFSCIIRNSDDDIPKLYSCNLEKTNFKDETIVYNFKEKECVCTGLKEIQTYIRDKNEQLRNLQSDDLTDDEFMILKCKIKCLDKLPREFKQVIEFIDIPGMNDSYCQKFIQKLLPLIVSNSCIFVYLIHPEILGSTDAAELLKRLYLAINSQFRYASDKFESFIAVLNKVDTVPLNEKERVMSLAMEFIRKNLNTRVNVIPFSARRKLVFNNFEEYMKDLNESCGGGISSYLFGPSLKEIISSRYEKLTHNKGNVRCMDGELFKKYTFLLDKFDLTYKELEMAFRIWEFEANSYIKNEIDEVEVKLNNEIANHYTNFENSLIKQFNWNIKDLINDIKFYINPITTDIYNSNKILEWRNKSNQVISDFKNDIKACFRKIKLNSKEILSIFGQNYFNDKSGTDVYYALLDVVSKLKATARENENKMKQIRYRFINDLKLLISDEAMKANVLIIVEILNALLTRISKKSNHDTFLCEDIDNALVNLGLSGFFLDLKRFFWWFTKNNFKANILEFKKYFIDHIKKNKQEYLKSVNRDLGLYYDNIIPKLDYLEEKNKLSSDLVENFNSLLTALEKLIIS